MNLGSALVTKGKLDEAIQECRRVVEIDPKFPHAHVVLGVALSSKDQQDEAIQEFRRAVDIDPDDALAHYNLGVALLKLRHFTEARDEAAPLPGFAAAGRSHAPRCCRAGATV